MTLAATAALAAVITALACAIPGTFVVLRGRSMVVDAMGHAMLPGVVIGYLVTGDLRSPLLIVGGAIAAITAVLCIELLARRRNVTGDAALGIVYPALFSIGVLLLSTRARHTHLDVNTVLVGDFNLAVLPQWQVGGSVLGSRYLWEVGTVCLVNVLFAWWFRKRLVASAFDPETAELLGLHPRRITLAAMTLTAFTVTVAFQGAGALLVLALVVVPPAVGQLLSDCIRTMMIATITTAVIGALLGFQLAYWCNAPTSAGMAVVFGALCVLAAGIVQMRRWRMRQRASSERVSLEGMADGRVASGLALTERTTASASQQPQPKGHAGRLHPVARVFFHPKS